MATDLAQLQDEVRERGYAHNFSTEAKSIQEDQTAEQSAWLGLRIVESVSFDNGTDPGDDVTLYLIESSADLKGYLILPDGFHSDPQKATFIDALLARNHSKR